MYIASQTDSACYTKARERKTKEDEPLLDACEVRRIRDQVDFVEEDAVGKG